MNKDIFLLIGTNLGDREQNLAFARDQIRELLGNIVSESSIYESEPWGFQAQEMFLNQVVEIESLKTCKEFLLTIKRIEEKMGRVKIGNQGYVSRLIDIDILYFGKEIVREYDLVVPHPHIENRKFTLLPLVEIAAQWVHPLFNLSNTELLHKCKDVGQVSKTSKKG